MLGVWTGTFVLLVLFGGVFADRFGARRMMVGADLVRVLTQGVLAVAFFAGTPPFWLLVSMAAVAGAAVAMFLPGVNGMVPLVASEPQRANATLKVADALAHLLGPALAGLLIAVTSAGTVYAIDAGTFLLSARAWRTRPARARRRQTPARTGVRCAANCASGGSPARTWMWAVIRPGWSHGVPVSPLVPLTSALIGERLGPNASRSGRVLPRRRHGARRAAGELRVRPARPLAAGAVAMALFTLPPVSVAVGSGMPVLLVGHVLGGGAMAFWSVMWATSVQTHTPPEVLNRVSAYELAGSVSGIAVGQILAGPATGLASPPGC